jgi:hypothetical protein
MSFLCQNNLQTYFIAIHFNFHSFEIVIFIQTGTISALMNLYTNI